MKIIYDFQTFTSQVFGGISRYFFELYSNRNSKVNIEIPLIFSNNHYLQKDEKIKYLNFFPKLKVKGKVRLMALINKIYTIYRIKTNKFDVFHPTYYDPYFLKYIGSTPFVLTVYDMIHEKFSDVFSANDKTSENKRILAEKASKIIAISQSTKRDLIDLFGIKEDKIEVIYLANTITISENVEMEISLPEKYILFVGSRGGYKNFKRFIQSISCLLQEDSDLSVVCVGGGVFDKNELAMFEELSIKDNVEQYSLDDKLLGEFYRNAIAFVFPSLYEGFGIPVLESFACDCPLICSNTSSLPEIAKNGAEYFNPNCTESIYSAIKNVIDSNELRSTLIKNGAERLKAFSWEITAEQTRNVYEKIL